MRGGTRSRSTSAGSSTLSGIFYFTVLILIQTRSVLADTLKTTAFSVALPALEMTQGYIIAITSLGGQLRVPGGSDGCISKHAVNRLVEFVALGKKPPSLSSFRRKKLIAKSPTQSTRASARSRWHQAIFLRASRSRRAPLVLMEKEGLGLPLTRLRSPPQRCSILLLAVLTGFLDGSYTSPFAAASYS